METERAVTALTAETFGERDAAITLGARPLGAPPQRFVTLYRDRPLRLACGAQVHNVRVAYRTWGAPGKPAVLVLHALTGDANADVWWRPLFGAGGALDPGRHFVVCANVIGGCAGSSTARELGGHPLGIFDMAVVQRELMLSLGAARFSVIGGSMGGMLALAALARFAGQLERAIVIGAPQRQSPWAAGWNVAARAALALDPVHGLEVARMFAMLSYRSPQSLALTQGGPGRVASYLEYQGRKLRERFTPDSYSALTGAMDAFGVDDEVLRRNEVPTLVVGINSDELYPEREVRALADKLGQSTYWQLDSPHGHDAFLIEAEQLGRRIGPFLTP